MGKIECIVCHRRCRGTVLKIGRDHIHKSCFNCKKCKKVLQEDKFHVRNQCLYCPDDYRLEFSVKCSGCGKTAEGDVIIALEKTFHKSCLRCQLCSRPLNAGEKTISHEDHFYCASCAASELRQISSGSPIKRDHFEKFGLPSAPPLHRNGRWRPNIHSNVEAYTRKESAERFPLDRWDSTLPISGERDHLMEDVSPAALSNGIGELTVKVDEIDMIGAASDFGRKHDPRRGYTMPSGYFASSQKEGVFATPSIAQTVSGGTSNSLYASSRRIFPPGVDYGRQYPISYLQLSEKGLTAVTNVDDLRSQTISSNMLDKLCSLDSSPETSHRLPPSTPIYTQKSLIQRISRRDTAQSSLPSPVDAQQGYVPPTTQPATSTSEYFSSGGSRHAASPNLADRPERDRYSRYRQLSPGSASADRARSASGRSTLPGSNFLSTRSQTYSSYSISNAQKRGMRVLAESLLPSTRRPRSPSPEAALFQAEVRKLAAYPGAQIPDANSLPVIDRYDWPAPPSPAVVMLDRRREREVGHDHLRGDTADWTMPRPENLLSDSQATSLQRDNTISPEDEAELERLNEKILTLKRATGTSGMSSAVVQYLEDEKRKCESMKVLDPVSASRSPSANREPPYRTRYANHRFSSPSRSNTQDRRYRTSDRTLSSSATGLLGTSINSPNTPRPGYTSGLLSSRTVSLPRPVNGLLNEWSHDSSHAYSHVAPSQRKVHVHGPPLHGVQQTLLTHSSNNDFSQDGLPSSPGLSIDGLDATELFNPPTSSYRTKSATLTGGLPPPSISGLRPINRPSRLLSIDGQKDFLLDSANIGQHIPRTVSETGRNMPLSERSTMPAGGLKIDQRYPTVQGFLRPAYSLPSKQEKTLRTYSYDELKVSSGLKLKGINGGNREEFLSPADFQRLFGMSISSFEQLPEWKRNDLKRRLDLF